MIRYLMVRNSSVSLFSLRGLLKWKQKETHLAILERKAIISKTAPHPDKHSSLIQRSHRYRLVICLTTSRIRVLDKATRSVTRMSPPSLHTTNFYHHNHYLMGAASHSISNYTLGQLSNHNRTAAFCSCLKRQRCTSLLGISRSRGYRIGAKRSWQRIRAKLRSFLRVTKKRLMKSRVACSIWLSW